MDIRALDLNLLPVLDALLRRRSVSLAARELDMSQPALSYALKRLREALGDPLFVRTGRGMLPTARGAALADPVRAILESVRGEVLAGGGFAPGTARRQFTLSLSDVGSYVLWPRIAAAVRATAAEVRLRLRTLEQAAVGPALEAGEVDLAVGAYPQLPGSLMQQRLFEREYVCLLRAGHPLAGRRISVKQFAAAEQVQVQAPSRIQERVDAALSRAGLARTVALEVPSYLMLPPLLESGDYLAVVPGQLAEAFRRQWRFVVAPVPLRLPPVLIRQHWHRRFNADAGNAWLRGVVAGLFRE